ncbi:MAG: T9SS type A sorting domain-containing protein [Bacteroidetes bacterium]|nr:T9SS type A sorting domain-containing protein [Bacteroidota bacterium]
MKNIVLLLLLCPLTALAQFPPDHAVLYHPAEKLPGTLVTALHALDGRLAVSLPPLHIIRLEKMHDDALRQSETEVYVLRTYSDATILLQELPVSLHFILPSLFPVEGRDAMGETGTTGSCCEEEIPTNCLVTEDDIAPAEVLATMQRQMLHADFDPNITSDVLVGSTAVAVFCVNNTEAQQQGVPTWTEQLRGDALGNIMVNLAWWSDQAAAYDKDKNFVIREYGPDHPAVAIDFDPTEGYTSTSISINDHKFQNPVMDALGYTGANQRVKMRAFCNDLRLEEETDWAYIAFLLVGDNSVRAHASFGGPSTVLKAASTANGFVFAHETGHIFNAFDEYFEHGRSSSRARQSRFGVPNGNLHFRNYPVQPCMMASSYRALSGYTAVHLGLADTVRYVTVETDPPMAAYEVEYVDPEDRVSRLARYQGTLPFAWGNGTRVRLRGLPAVAHDGVTYGTPVWQQSGEAEFLLEIDAEVSPSISLGYSATMTPADFSFEYLTLRNALASEIVQDALSLGERSAAFVGPKGISIWNDTGKVILDYAFSNDRLDSYRQSYAIARGPDGTVYFTSHGSEILGWKDEQLFALEGPVPDLTYRNVTVTGDGAVWATDGGFASGRGMQASGLHRFHGGQVTAFTMDNAPLPSNAIVAIAATGSSAVWLGLSGHSAADHGLFLFDPVTMDITDHSDRVASPNIVRIRNIGPDSILVISSGTNPDVIERFVTLLVGGNTASIWNTSWFRTSGALFDATIDRQGRLVIATTLGIAILGEDESWTRIRIDNSELLSNICYAVSIEADGAIIAGTNIGAVRISTAAKPTSVGHFVAATPRSAHLHAAYPNPLRDAGAVSVTFDRPQTAELRLHDILGRTVAEIAGGHFPAGQYSFTLPVALRSGTYLISLTTPGGRQIRKLQKE